MTYKNELPGIALCAVVTSAVLIGTVALVNKISNDAADRDDEHKREMERLKEKQRGR